MTICNLKAQSPINAGYDCTPLENASIESDFRVKSVARFRDGYYPSREGRGFSEQDAKHSLAKRAVSPSPLEERACQLLSSAYRMSSSY